MLMAYWKNVHSCSTDQQIVLYNFIKKLMVSGERSQMWTVNYSLSTIVQTGAILYSLTNPNFVPSHCLAELNLSVR